MKSIFRTSLIAFLTMSSSLSPLPAYDGPSQLMNPGFENDMGNVGFPDDWKIALGAEVTLTREDVASGSRALVMTEGYGAVSQDLNVESLANRAVMLSLVARSPDAAHLGVRIGYFVNDPDKGNTWVDAPMIWDKPLGPDFETYTATRKLPAEALDGRFWFCLYRSKREGTVVIDDISLELLNEQSSMSPKQEVVFTRELGYVKNKVGEARALKPNQPEWTTINEELTASAPTEDGKPQEHTFEEMLEKLRTLNMGILSALYPKRSFTASWQNPFERLDASKVPVESESTWKLITLPGETAALGVELSNPSDAPQTLSLRLEGLPDKEFAVQMRRQVLMETWYTKGATVLADPLTLLPQNGDAWTLVLDPGETTRIYLSLKSSSGAAAATFAGSLAIKSGSEQRKLSFEAEVLAPSPPTEPEFAFYQFYYSNMNVAKDFPAETCQDLESHGVTDIEWAFMPPAKFAKDGKLLEIDWTTHDRWLTGFKNSAIRLNIFWEPTYPKLTTGDSEFLKVGSPEWKRGLQEILAAYLKHAAELGLPRERFTILPMDELHSAHLEKSPDEEITSYLQVSKVIRETNKEMPQFLTIGNYTFPTDVKAILSTLDVAMPHWPLPEKLGRNAPDDYSPRQAYFEKTFPMLKEARKERDMKIWSYHVMRGKSDDVLLDSLGYPVLAVASGLTGFGYWAYNVTSGSTWDDQDGTILDYSVIYDGRENHPLNRKYNTTSELIVPSLQWEAQLAGKQNGQILLYLMAQAEKKDLSSELQSEVEVVIAAAREMGGKEGYGGPKLTYEAMHDLGLRLRKTYALVAASRKNS